ncbi:putative glucan 1,3-beta-glucosidase [Helianthus annuus]|nr:putative glucan 1,3-beta-glucosidase [Helianthus annuus]
MIDYGFARYGWDDKKKSMVCRDPRWGRCFESISEDPNIVQDMIEIIPGLQGEIPINGRKGVPFVDGQYNKDCSFNQTLCWRW